MCSNQRTTLSILVDNNSGVLARVAGLFARRGYNIDSLTVSATNDPLLSRITVSVQGDRQIPVSYTHLSIFHGDCPKDLDRFLDDFRADSIAPDDRNLFFHRPLRGT